MYCCWLGLTWPLPSSTKVVLITSHLEIRFLCLRNHCSQDSIPKTSIQPIISPARLVVQRVMHSSVPRTGNRNRWREQLEPTMSINILKKLNQHPKRNRQITDAQGHDVKQDWKKNRLLRTKGSDRRGPEFLSNRQNAYHNTLHRMKSVSGPRGRVVRYVMRGVHPTHERGNV
jgi:hypothetical protein